MSRLLNKKENKLSLPKICLGVQNVVGSVSQWCFQSTHRKKDKSVSYKHDRHTQLTHAFAFELIAQYMTYTTDLSIYCYTISSYIIFL